MSKDDRGILKKMFAYKKSVDTCNINTATRYAYTKYSLSTDKRNIILLAVPTVFVIGHSGERMYVGETYDKMQTDSCGIVTASRLLERTTIPHNRSTMPTLLNYLTPDIYNTTIFKNAILSPFKQSNRRFYRYTVSGMINGVASVIFKPKVKNTQFVTGLAFVDIHTGRVKSTTFDGEYDMIRFSLELDMNEKGWESLRPKQCKLQAKFKFLGNKISSTYLAIYGLDAAPNDSLPAERNDTSSLAAVRPVPLGMAERDCYARNATGVRSSGNGTAKNKFTQFMWDNIGQNLIGRIKSDFGSNKQGNVRINPILNPLYFGYSGRKGVTYKFDIRGNYSFTENQRASIRFKAGYSFKQHQLYFTIPAFFYFNNRRNGFVEMQLGNGNRITNSDLAKKLMSTTGDSAKWERIGVEYFKDMSFKTNVHYDICEKFGIQGGFTFHRRTALHKQAFKQAGIDYQFTSSAPTVELQYRPVGFNGPIITANYERSIKGLLTANMAYERFEFDVQYKHKMQRMSEMQMRMGTGFYTNKDRDWYFLDYTNFHEENVIGGWNDNWTNDFELLSSKWYNASKYYVRANLTYESPVMITAWIPLLGHYIEKERFYINTLSVTSLHPYIEYGYGISTRLLSAGMFVGQKNGRFDGFGVRFGFELFRNW